MRRLPRLLILLVVVTAALLLSGCGHHRLTAPLGQAATALFTSATFADLQLVGIKTGPLVPLQAGTSAVPGKQVSQELTDVLGQSPLGVLLQITKVGETTPWWIFCPAGELQKRCEEIPSNARVSFTGQPLGRGGLFLPTHLTWSAR